MLVRDFRHVHKITIIKASVMKFSTALLLGYTELTKIVKIPKKSKNKRMLVKKPSLWRDYRLAFYKE